MRKFSRKKDQRLAFVKSLASNLILKEKIKTTEARAKEMRSYVERLIFYAKKGSLAGTRLVAGKISAPAAKKMIKEIAPRYTERNGGYVRITPLARRLSDSSKMVYIEFIK